MFVGVGASRVR